MRNEVINQTQPIHLITFDGYNLCDLVARGRLCKLTVPVLRDICCHFELEISWPKSQQLPRRKAPYVEVLEKHVRASCCFDALPARWPFQFCHILCKEILFSPRFQFWVIYGGGSPYHRQPNQPCLFSLAPTVRTSSKIILCKRLQQLNNSSFWMSYGQHQRFFNTVCKCWQTIFFKTPFTLECSFKFLFRAHAGFIIAQFRTLADNRPISIH